MVQACVSDVQESTSEISVSNDRQLLIESKAFAVEVEKRSWFELAVTLTSLVGVLFVGIYSENIFARLSVSLILALLFVRIFAIYHDYLHSSIFRKSSIAGSILKSFGLLLLTPPSVWKASHNHHHKNNSKLFGANIGSFKVMTVDCYRRATLVEKLEYRLSRSLVVILMGYFFVFLWGMSIVPLFRNPWKHLDCVLALAVHGLVGGGVAYFLGWQSFLFLFALPLLIATATGTYLFYIQHNFPGVLLACDRSWTYARAALQSSSYLKTGTLINWFTANIGFHHVHHLNAKIPFYRLAEAHQNLEPLHEAVQTTLSLKDIWRSLQLKLWDEDLQRFVGFSQVSAY